MKIDDVYVRAAESAVAAIALGYVVLFVAFAVSAAGILVLGPILALPACGLYLGCMYVRRNEVLPLLNREREALDICAEAVRQRDAARAALPTDAVAEPQAPETKETP